MTDLEALLREAEKQGCRVQQGGNNHWKIYAPNGTIIVTGSTPSDHRSVLNTRARLRRAGVVVGPR